MRRPDRLPPAPAGRGLARQLRTDSTSVANLSRAGRAGGGARRRHRPLGRRHAARAWGNAVAGQIQSHPESRPAGAHGAGAMRRAQPGHQRGGGRARPVLRARPVEPDRLHHRWQRGRKLRRRALPEIRSDAAQRAESEGLHGGRRAHRVRWRRARRARLRPAGAGRRQRGHAGGDDRGHRQAHAQAAAGAVHHGQLCRRAARGRRGGGHHCAGHHPGRAGDDGQAHDRRRRGFRARRLRPGRGRHPAVRKRRHAARGGRGSGAHGGRAAPGRRHPPGGVRRRGRAAEILERAQERLSRQRAHQPRLHVHGFDHPAQAPGRYPAIDSGDGAQVRPALLQRFSCGRWQPASADPVRCE